MKTKRVWPFQNIWTLAGPYKTLHLTWFAFFLTFVAWFNMAPLATTIQTQLGLTAQQMKVLAICNVALTIPARILIGMLLDAFGPRKIYSALLVIMSIPCFIFALSNSFIQLVISRLLLGVIGAGFVVGVRMIAEWFPPKTVGFAEGIYGGWGNLGSAVAASILPLLGLYLFGGENGWRWAIMLTGLACFVYGFIYYHLVRDTPDGATYHKPARHGAMEVTSWAGMAGLIGLFLPLFLALGILAWKLGEIGFLNDRALIIIYVTLVLFYIIQCVKIFRVNRPALSKGIPPQAQYEFKLVAILSIAYLVNFGSSLAVVSMLPEFFETIWLLTPQMAGSIAASYALMNLVARPLGGWFSDQMGSRKKTLIYLQAGLGLGYLAMSQLDSSWSVLMAVLVTVTCSFFVQAGAGAVCAMIPLVKKSITGQVAGMVGAYANVGAVLFLMVFSFVTPQVFFLTIAIMALFSTGYCFMMKEPEGSFAEAYQAQPGPL